LKIGEFPAKTLRFLSVTPVPGGYPECPLGVTLLELRQKPRQ